MENIKLTEIKNQKIILYLTKVVTELNTKYNNLIKEEKFQRAIKMFTNRVEDYETIKAMIDWHVENEKKQYFEHQNKLRRYKDKRKDKKLIYKNIS